MSLAKQSLRSPPLSTLFLALCCVAYGGPALSQSPIPVGATANFEDFAVIPDSTNNNPARLNLLTPDPQGRLFVNDQRGPLYTVTGGGATGQEYLDLRDFAGIQLAPGNEAGFQSFAFHPEFQTIGAAGFGRFYTAHSTSNTAATPDFDPGGNTAFHSVLLEWQTSTPNAPTFTASNPAAPFREVMRLDQPFSNHNVGQISFNNTAAPGDADYGNLYIAVGDGGSGGDPQENAQDLTNPYGAILRIDPLGTNSDNGQYGIVAANQFASDGDPNTLAEITAYGLRNPQRFGWDVNTANLFIADIGQNAVEEIDLYSDGANFGWDQREGSQAFEGPDSAAFIGPAAEYSHSNTATGSLSTGNRAVTVGEVLRGSAIGQLEGNLILGDFPTGLLFALDVDNDPLNGGQGGLVEVQLLNEADQAVRFLDVINSARADRGLSASNRADTRFGFNTPGEVFLLNKRDGIIRRLIASPSAQAVSAPSSLMLMLTALATLLIRRLR